MGLSLVFCLFTLATCLIQIHNVFFTQLLNLFEIFFRNYVLKFYELHIYIFKKENSYGYGAQMFYYLHCKSVCCLLSACSPYHPHGQSCIPCGYVLSRLIPWLLKRFSAPLFHLSPVPLGEKQVLFTLLAGNMQALYCKCCFSLVNAYAMNLGLGCLTSNTHEKALLWDTVAWMCKVT